MWTLICPSSFFGHFTNEEAIEEYVKDTREAIFYCMELSKMSYTDVVQMPVYELSQYNEWKSKLEKERQENEARSIERMK